MREVIESKIRALLRELAADRSENLAHLAAELQIEVQKFKL